MPTLPPYTCKKKRLIRGAIPEGLCKLQTNGQFYETWHGREASGLLESVAMPLYPYLTQEYNAEAVSIRTLVAASDWSPSGCVLK